MSIEKLLPIAKKMGKENFLAYKKFYKNSKLANDQNYITTLKLKGINLIDTLDITLQDKENKLVFAKEGFAIVALAWLSVSLIGALPFYVSKEIPHYMDAFFETVSGFSTTGATILTDIEAMSHGMLFWR